MSKLMSKPISKHTLYRDGLKAFEIDDHNEFIEMPDPYENVPIIELTKQYDPTDEQWKEHLKNYLRYKGLLND
jgi:hypothetical protein